MANRGKGPRAGRQTAVRQHGSWKGCKRFHVFYLSATCSAKQSPSGATDELAGIVPDNHYRIGQVPEIVERPPLEQIEERVHGVGRCRKAVGS